MRQTLSAKKSLSSHKHRMGRALSNKLSATKKSVAKGGALSRSKRVLMWIWALMYNFTVCEPCENIAGPGSLFPEAVFFLKFRSRSSQFKNPSFSSLADKLQLQLQCTLMSYDSTVGQQNKTVSRSSTFKTLFNLNWSRMTPKCPNDSFDTVRRSLDPRLFFHEPLHIL